MTRVQRYRTKDEPKTLPNDLTAWKEGGGKTASASQGHLQQQESDYNPMAIPARTKVAFPSIVCIHRS